MLVSACVSGRFVTVTTAHLKSSLSYLTSRSPRGGAHDVIARRLAMAREGSLGVRNKVEDDGNTAVTTRVIRIMAEDDSGTVLPLIQKYYDAGG